MRRLLLSIVVLLVLVTFSTTPIGAQQPDPAAQQPGGAATGGGDNQREAPELTKFKAAQTTGIDLGKPSVGFLVGSEEGVASSTVSWGICQILGGCPKPGPDGKAVLGVGLLQQSGNYLAMFFDNPPADTQTYVADLLNSAGVAITQPAYAQGIGFSSLNPILQIWKTFRNIAYFFFVVIFIAIGFMIMFRQKISSQTVITAQQALPQIIVALLAVTFSYAIAGLLIDLMYVAMNLLVVIFGRSTDLYTQNVFEQGWNLWKGDGGFANSVYDTVSNFVQAVFVGENGLGENVLAFGAGLTASIIFSIALLIAIFRLFFELLRVYISLILSIAFAPLILMLGAIPGKSTFAGWIKSIIGNLIVFPLFLIMLIIYHVMSENISDASSGFLAPYLIGQGEGNAIVTLIGIGIILITPDIIKQAQKAIGGGGGVFEQLIGQNLPDAIKKGWTGDAELIPGVPATNLRKGIFSRFGGVSGENAVKKAGIYGSAALAGLPGLAEGAYRRRQGEINTSPYLTMKQRSGSVGRFVGKALGDEQINPDKDPNKPKTPSK